MPRCGREANLNAATRSCDYARASATRKSSYVCDEFEQKHQIDSADFAEAGETRLGCRIVSHGFAGKAAKLTTSANEFSRRTAKARPCYFVAEHKAVSRKQCVQRSATKCDRVDQTARPRWLARIVSGRRFFLKVGRPRVDMTVFTGLSP
jgi:hypothetical protein